jgi:hypothetical protein
MSQCQCICKVNCCDVQDCDGTECPTCISTDKEQIEFIAEFQIHTIH